VPNLKDYLWFTFSCWKIGENSGISLFGGHSKGEGIEDLVV